MRNSKERERTTLNLVEELSEVNRLLVESLERLTSSAEKVKNDYFPSQFLAMPGHGTPDLTP